jgi:hypothetical protein
MRVSFGDFDDTRIYEARFDFNLLQEWTRVETGPKKGDIERKPASILFSQQNVN